MDWTPAFAGVTDLIRPSLTYFSGKIETQSLRVILVKCDRFPEFNFCFGVKIESHFPQLCRMRANTSSPLIAATWPDLNSSSLRRATSAQATA
jgi:hypothetical protein